MNIGVGTGRRVIERKTEAGGISGATATLTSSAAEVNDSLSLELPFVGHNIVLMVQAMGLGGLYFNGMDGLSVLGVTPRPQLPGHACRGWGVRRKKVRCGRDL